MKKLAICLIIVLLVVALAPCVLAAGSASLTGPGVVRAGDTITVNFTAGGGILGGSGTMNFDTNLLTLQGYTPKIGGSWVVEFNGNKFVFYDNAQNSPIQGSATIFSATFKVNPALETGASISVSATGVTLSDGKQDMGIGTVSYGTTIARPLSGNCDLASMTVGNATITPAFSPDVTQYTASVPFATSKLDVTAVAADANAKVAIQNTQLLAATTTSVQVTVTAENGTTKTYRINVYRAQDPNYVPSSNSELKSLTVADQVLSPAFDPQVNQYYVWLPYEKSTVTVTAATADARATYAVSQIPELVPGTPTDITVTVTAEDKSTREYVITVFRAPAHEDVEEFLYGPAETEPAPTETTAPPETTVPPTTVAPATTIAPTTGEPGPVPHEPQQEGGIAIHWVVLLMIASLAAGVGIGALLKSVTGKKSAR